MYFFLKQKAKYILTGEVLGQGSYGRVETCRNVSGGSGGDFAVKIIDKTGFYFRQRVLKEIETFYLCSGHENIIQVSIINYKVFITNCIIHYT